MRRLAQGKEDVTVGRESLGPLFAEQDAQSLAQELYVMDCVGFGFFNGLMDVDPPVKVGDEYIVRKYLTPQGEKAYQALEIGWFWNNDTNEEAIEETFDFYRSLMKRGKFSAKHADWIVGNQDERFRELRNEVVYFKLRCKRVGDFFVETPNGN